MKDNLYDNKSYIETLKCSAETIFPWELLEGKKILVAGATGMIGKFFVDLIMYKNNVFESACDLTIFSRNETKARNVFSSDWFNSPHFRYICHDISSPVSTIPDDDYDYVLNFASNTHPIAYSEKPINTIWDNVVGTKNLLDLCSQKSNSRFILTSSVEIYGENRGDTELFDEKYLGYLDSNTLRAGYPESKRVCEALCQAYIKEKEQDAVIVRLPRVFGPTMGKDDSKAVSQFIKKAVNGEDIILKSSGSQYYSFLYVPDAVMGILTVMLKGICGRAYNIADTKCDGTLKNVAEFCAVEGNVGVVFELPDEKEKAGYSTATKARLDGREIKELGWNPKYSLEEGLQQTIKILKE